MMMNSMKMERRYNRVEVSIGIKKATKLRNNNVYEKIYKGHKLQR